MLSLLSQSASSHFTFPPQAGTQINKADAGGATVLHALASVSLPDAAVLISEIIDRGAAVDQLDDDGYTPLARAVVAGSISSTFAPAKGAANEKRTGQERLHSSTSLDGGLWRYS